MGTDNQGEKNGDTKRSIAVGGVYSGMSLLPQSGLADGFYIVSKLSNKAITIVPEGVQLQQTELTWPGNEPSSDADLTIVYSGSVTNPANFAAGTYNTYRIQWGSISPSTLINEFWSLQGTAATWGMPIVSMPSAELDNQRFIIQPTGNADTSIYIRILNTGRYVQIAGGSDVNTTVGAKVEQSDFSGDLNQKFFVKKRAY
ncbi:hypothetical protein DN068_03095 [Taibaiella soli]|uniref:Uncharacterized protein n=2 Tax=Taibaiella soli TaxID=1649169 RepID=A0A2W2B3J2_9BACT|nr:hypothetical protein DN068_03095 [Taibaiella soli]